MYPPRHHQSNAFDKMLLVVKQFPLAMLVSAKDDTAYTTHIPIIYNEDSKKLVGHIDFNNPQVESLTEGSKVTAIFKGPDTYISPSIYSTKQLPTWNYIIVHVTGTITLISQPEAVKKTLVDMTAFLEGENSNFTLSMDDPRMDRLVAYIQTFEIEITDCEGKFKLSQDKNKTDYNLAKKELIAQSKLAHKQFIEAIYSGIKS